MAFDGKPTPASLGASGRLARSLRLRPPLQRLQLAAPAGGRSAVGTGLWAGLARNPGGNRSTRADSREDAGPSGEVLGYRC